MSPDLRVRGTDPTTGEPVDLAVSGGRIVDGAAAEAVTVTGFVVPGFVDAHCHVGYSPHGPATPAEAEQQALANLRAGALALRDCGSPVDTRELVDRDDLPVLIRSGRHVAFVKRYIRDLGVDLDDPADLPAEVARQIAYGSGQWVKIVGDWIDRDIGDLAPLWPDDVLARAVAVAHAAGCRVTTHVFGEDALPGLLAAGVDCIEHGTGLTEQTIATAAAQGTHLVPTLINIENFPSFAAQANRFPTYAAHMLDLHRRHLDRVRDAVDAGVAVHAGTDAGGYIEHGRIADEVIALGQVLGMRRALAAAAHEARQWLGVPGTEVGDPADLVVFDEDPTQDPTVLKRPALIIRAGRVVRGQL
ncbi:amidohydrolase family protein [Nakamurella multipartita]|uniref:Amidohydrolase n=1 Tax=Nakamurella multipartita (strain ATCC 700099 / DSM 44233 / CIP 104796 / JCM 9543 / NBRC 105858 / Y-104) TaxID=479431 RepID=C8XBX1_NAKMY|nr:amidohydrolase family protein [Nakamurella multipartita]ACV79475.1 amidohydrolase [Nakamurella multipartita DSM 44233]